MKLEVSSRSEMYKTAERPPYGQGRELRIAKESGSQKLESGEQPKLVLPGSSCKLRLRLSNPSLRGSIA